MYLPVVRHIGFCFGDVQIELETPAKGNIEGLCMYVCVRGRSQVEQWDEVGRDEHSAFSCTATTHPTRNTSSRNL